jgi:hypothetical protein
MSHLNGAADQGARLPRVDRRLDVISKPEYVLRAPLHGLEREPPRCDVFHVDIEERRRPDSPVRYRRDEQAHLVDQPRGRFL